MVSGRKVLPMTAATDNASAAAADVPVFSAPYAPPDEDLAAFWLAHERPDAAAEQRIDALATPA